MAKKTQIAVESMVFVIALGFLTFSNAPVQSVPVAGSGSGSVAGPPPRSLAPTGADAVAPGVAESGTPAAMAVREVYSSDTAMVKPRPGVELQWIAGGLGASVEQPVGQSGWGAIRLAPNTNLLEALDGLAQSPEIMAVSRQAIIRGAGEKILDWHLPTIERERVAAGWFSQWTVAVIDTGVAYEDYTDDQYTYVTAATLGLSPIVAPFDFVNDDAHPNDDHQHGTHIASTIASSGDVTGVVPGAGLMPLKVLDANNSGYELDLVEAVYWATDHGADVINMSLAFGEGYTASSALIDALDYAADAGVVLVGAAGNEGAAYTAWPAASPLVIAVAAGTVKNDGYNDLIEVDYANVSLLVDVAAPGGDLAHDMDENAIPDGIVAETINQGDPSTTGLWLYSGSSQAAAVVSGAAVWLLDQGIEPHLVRNYLSRGIESHDIDDGGTGYVNFEKLDQEVSDPHDDVLNEHQYAVALLPFLNGDHDSTRPRVMVLVVDETGAKVKDAEVFGMMRGSSQEAWKCKTDDKGLCFAEGDEVKYDQDEGPPPLLWEVSADAIVFDKVVHRPGRALVVTDSFEFVLAGIQASGELDDTTALAFEWDTRDDDELGKVVEGITVVDWGVGFTSMPVGSVFNLRFFDMAQTSRDVYVDMDGVGFTSMPVGSLRFRQISLGGVGFTSMPVGSFSLFAMPAFGWASDINFSAYKMTSAEGVGFTSMPVGSWQTGVYLFKSSKLISPTPIDGSSLEQFALTGNGTGALGYGGGTLVSAAAGDAMLAPAVSLSAAGAGSMPLALP